MNAIRIIQFIFFGICFFSTKHFLAHDFTLIWLNTKEGAHHWWEHDWVQEICNGLVVKEIYDPAHNQFIDKAILVVSVMFKKDSKKVFDYIEQYKQRKLKFIIIHLSDEFYATDTSFYKFAPLVIRNYWHKKYKNLSNVVFFPLGYRKEFCPSEPPAGSLNNANHRKYLWSFAGQVTKSTRQEMIKNMLKIKKGFTHIIDSFGSNASLGPVEYRNLLLQTTFVPCPRGWSNFESYRVYEALECGAIPIVEKEFTNDYFANLLGKYPFPALQKWHEVEKLISFYANNPMLLENLQMNCYRWWMQYKVRLYQELRSKILKAMQQ